MSNRKYVWYEGDQKYELCIDELIYICCCCKQIGDEIKAECKRRDISHWYCPYVREYTTTKDGNEKLKYMCKIGIRETGLRVEELVDWAKMKFNGVSTKSGWCDHHKIIVWTQYQKDVSVGSGGYDDDGCYLGYDVHWA